MNGSYSVPIGSSRSPLIECESPSAESRMNRLFSAMPSSMCWPLGENSQVKVEGMRSFLKVSAISSRANRPRRLTHGPRLVETVTSGEVVTMRSANGSLAARDLVEQRAEAGLRRGHLLGRHRQARPAPRRSPPCGGGARSAASGTASRNAAAHRDRPTAPRTCPIRGRGGSAWRRGSSPSASASSGRRDCPCGRRTAGRSP